MTTPLPLAALLGLLLSGCVVYARPRPVPPPPPVAEPAPGFISERAAVDIAFQLARQRGLSVDRVQHVHLDGAGRWHVNLRGRGEGANVVLDARDGRLLKGKFRARGERGDEWGDD